MALAPGTRLGAYEIVGLLGAGGMGEVYRAVDTRLDRHVALKILPETVASDAERTARFQREAKVLASLNHPHIAALFGLEEAAGRHFLTMELVEGETLADRIARGPIPVDEALPIARQIAEALEAAHEQGIVHRDLKPANIKVRPDGAVKVLDFGLAKALASESATATNTNLADSPTITSPGAVTGIGVLLGTAAYMAPEQAKGRPVDKRADIWAFGCVLYEMLTASAPFDRGNVTETLAAILMNSPDWSRLPAHTPEPLRTLLRRCLQKDLKVRLPDIGSARLELDDALATLSTMPIGRSERDVPRPGRWSVLRRPAVVSGVFMLLALGLAAAFASRRSSDAVPNAGPSLSALGVLLPRSAPLDFATLSRPFVLSPDGSHFIYASTNQLAVRALDSLATRFLPGTEVARGPFISPDGEWVAFALDSPPLIKKVPIRGGAVRNVSRHPGGGWRGATWTANDDIIFASGALDSGLMRVPASGGNTEVLTAPDRASGEVDHVWPSALPNGRGLLFTITSASLDQAQVAVLDLKTGQRRILLAGSDAQYVDTGHIVYGFAGGLSAAPFDAERLELTGPPTRVVEQVALASNGATHFSVVRNGTLVYGRGELTGSRSLVWMDRLGHETMMTAPSRGYFYPRLSPDGRRAAFDVREVGSEHIWTLDLRDGTFNLLTLGSALHQYPVWASDGSRIFFASDMEGAIGIHWQPVGRGGLPQRLIPGREGEGTPYSVSQDGRYLVFRRGEGDLGVVEQLGSVPRSRMLLNTPANEINGEISPDGRFLAYQSDESGRYEIYVRPFPDVHTSRWQISLSGGTRPAWSADSMELFFVDPLGNLMAAAVTTAAGLSVRAPIKLFAIPASLAGFAGGRIYDVAKDGRFLVVKDNRPGEGAPTVDLVIVLNWTGELKRLVPTN